MTASFVILTAARNEERFIGRTIASVCNQTALPMRWVIVDDASTDATAHIVRRASDAHPFIRLLQLSRGGDRNFASKSWAIQAAYRSLTAEPFNFVVVADADVGLERDDLFAKMLAAFAASPRLGIAGGEIFEPAGDGWKRRQGNRADAVSGALQIFRRACFDACGGYTPLRYGGEDWLVQIEAIMRGWTVDVLLDQRILHYRPTSSADGRWRGVFRSGLMDASFGSDPWFEMLKCLRRWSERPLVAGVPVRLAGYLWWHLSGRAPLIPPRSVAFLRQQQRLKTRRWMSAWFRA